MTMLTTDTMYGSDRNGLIWGYRFAPDQAASPISAEEAIALLSSPEAVSRSEFVWLHFSKSNTATEPWLLDHLELPQAFFDTMHAESRSTRIEQEDDVLLAVLNDVLFAFSFDVSAVETTSICITPNLMISTRLRPLRSIEKLRRLVRQGDIFSSPVELLSQRISTSRSELSSLRRVLVRLQRLLAPEPSAFFRLINRPPEWITKDDLQDLRESAEEIAAAVSDTQALVERVKLIQEELVALLNERTGRTIYVLTVVTVLALPINMVAGLFGMNVGGIPLASDKLGFWSIVAILLVLTGLLAYLAFGRWRD